jgi:hypothetical protein
VGQRTFETKSFYLILAEKLFTLPAANEMLPLSALFAGKSREIPGRWRVYRYLSFPIDRTNSGVETLGQSAGEFGGLAVFRLLDV